MQPSRRELPHIWLPGIVDNIAQFLDANEISCTLRLLDKATAYQFANRRVVQLSQPVPHHAFRYKWDNDQIMRTYTLSERCHFVALTAASGCLPNLELAVQRAGIDLTHFTEGSPLSAAAAAGHIHICIWLKQRGNFGDLEDSRPLVAASRTGQQEICTWLLDNGCLWKAVYAAARGGHPTLLDWLLARKPHQTPQLDSRLLIEAAAEGCDLATLQRLYGEWQPQENVPQAPIEPNAIPPKTILAAAACSPTPDWQAKVEWLETLRGSNAHDTSVCFAAARCPDALERLTWLQGRGYPVDVWMALAAIVSDNLAVLRVLLDVDVKQDHVSIAFGAAFTGQLAALKLLHERGLLTELEYVLQISVKFGHLEMVDWLVQELGVQMDDFLHREGEELVHRMAEEGNVAMLEWLQERGCRGNEEVFVRAARGGCEEVIEWLLAYGYNFPPSDAPVDAVYFFPWLEEDLATLACLHRLGCEYEDFLDFSKEDLPLGVWTWLENMKLV